MSSRVSQAHKDKQAERGYILKVELYPWTQNSISRQKKSMAIYITRIDVV